MSEEEKDLELDEEYEDLDELDTVPLQLEEFSDLEGLEDLPEDQEVGFTNKDVIVTYGDKIEDEKEELEKLFKEKVEQLKNAETEQILQEMTELLNTSKILEAYELTSKIASYIASLFTSQGLHSEATEYYLLSVSSARKSSNKKLHLASLTPFGLNLMHFEPQDASVVFSQAINLATELNDEEAYATNTIYFADSLPMNEINKKLTLYNEAKKYFSSVNNALQSGLIDFKLGELYYLQRDYKTSFVYLENAVKALKDSTDIELNKRVVKLFRANQKLLYSGYSLSFRLSLPPPEKIEESLHVKKIFQLIAETGTFDIVKNLRMLKNVQEPGVDEPFDNLKFIFDGFNYKILERDRLKEFSSTLEEIADLYLKNGSLANAFYNYLGSQILTTYIGEKKRGDKNEKKLLKTIELLGNERRGTIIDDLYLYYQFQLAWGIKDTNPKQATKYLENCIGLAQKKNNPLYEALCRELLAEIKGLSELD
ncbi:MAG: hypothetical protein ACTSP3_16135, partial [Candidatus Heimdallarchaeaceae archaeon]